MKKHASVKMEVDGKLADIPLIGLKPSSTEERCDQCQQTFHMQTVVLTEEGFRCPKCLEI